MSGKISHIVSLFVMLTAIDCTSKWTLTFKYKIIGLYSSCFNDDKYNGSYHETASKILQQYSKDLFTTDCVLPGWQCPGDNVDIKFSDFVEYEGYDVCYDRELLLEILLNLTLNSTNFAEEGHDEVKRRSKIFLISTYLNSEMTNIASYVLMRRGRPVDEPAFLFFRDGLTLKYTSLFHARKNLKTAYSQGNTIKNSLNALGWRDMVVILLQPTGQEDLFWTQQYDDFLRFLENENADHFCYNAQRIDSETQFLNTAKILQGLDPNIPIILYGSEVDQYRFVEAVEGPLIFRRKWAFHNVNDERILLRLRLNMMETNFIFFSHNFYLNAKRLVMQNEAHAPKLTKYYVGNSTNTYITIYEKMTTFLQWMKMKMINYGNQRSAVLMLDSNSNNFHFATAMFLGHIGTNKVLTKHFYRLDIPPQAKTLLRTQCQIPQCPLG